MNAIGSFNSSGSPIIEIGVSGPVTNPTSFVALVDTGFTGFLMLPLLQAFPVGLILNGTMPITLADGSTQTKLTCLGEVHFDNESQVGLIIIEPQSTEILVGMDFLRKFERELVVDPVNSIVRLTKSILAAAPVPPPIPTIVTASPPPPVPPSPAPQPNGTQNHQNSN